MKHAETIIKKVYKWLGVDSTFELCEILSKVDIKGKSPLIGAAGEHHFDKFINSTPGCSVFPAPDISNDRKVVFPNGSIKLVSVKTYTKNNVRIGHGDKKNRFQFSDGTYYFGNRRLLAMPFDVLASCGGARGYWEEFRFYQWDDIRAYTQGTWTVKEKREYTYDQLRELDEKCLLTSINLSKIPSLNLGELVFDSFQNDYQAIEYFQDIEDNVL